MDKQATFATHKCVECGRKWDRKRDLNVVLQFKPNANGDRLQCRFRLCRKCKGNRAIGRAVLIWEKGARLFFQLKWGQLND